MTEIAVDARLHYHRHLTETYFFLECGPDANMQLDEEVVNVHPGLCILIRPGTRHRALGHMRVLIVVLPKFIRRTSGLTAGCMVPNQYFVPGMGSPMPIMGKYYVVYGANVLAPEELGRRNVERMVYELINDNIGMCRFHRQWSEPLAREIALHHFGLDIDFKGHHFELARQINALETVKSVPWETERMADMLTNYMRWLVEDGAPLDKLESGIHHDRLYHALVPSTQGKPVERPADPTHLPHAKATAHAFWKAIKKGQETAFAAGPEIIPTVLKRFLVLILGGTAAQNQH